MLSEVDKQSSEASSALEQVMMAEHGEFSRKNGPFQTDMEYMKMNELKYTLKSIRSNLTIKMFESFTKPGSISTEEGEKAPDQVASNERNGCFKIEKVVNCDDIKRRRTHLDSMINFVDRNIETRLKAPTQQGCSAFVPRIIKFCDHYKLSPAESELVHIMVIVQGSSCPYVLNCLVEEDYFKRLQSFQRLSGLSEAEIDQFCDPERAHLKEGLVTSEEDHGIHFNLRCSRTCVQLLYGYKLHSDEMLKVSQTALEVILSAEKQSDESLSVPKSTVTMDNLDGDGLGRKRKSSGVEQGRQKSQRTKVAASELDDLLESNGKVDHNNMISENILDQLTNEESPHIFVDDDESTTFQPYPANNQLEYLEEGFQVVAVMIRANAARLKDDMKKEGTRINSWDLGGESKGGRRELQAKFSLLEKRMEKRIKETEKHCESANGVNTGVGSPSEIDTKYALPRLEIIAKRLNLDSFEKKIILLLIGKTVSPLVKTLMDTLEQGSRYAEDMANVGQVLSILCQDFRTQISNRKYFYRSGRLISNGIISMSKARWHQNSGDLTDQRIVLDRRVLDWAVGLDSEINELVEGSDLYIPKVSLQQVVLPRGKLGPVVKHCRAYDSFCLFKEAQGMEKSMSYGNSLVILLCGKSGTGKTMTVNAIANDLGKKVLLVDFGSLTGRRDGAGELDADLRGLFREAKMSNAVIFFDECESIFRSRDRGGDRLLNALLTEIERHHGIVFLATNRPHDLDEAMHRRITTVVQFRPPDFNMRLRIWESLLQVGSSVNVENGVKSRKLSADNDVDLSALAIKYELTGGFIKNALLSALLSALSRFKKENTSARKGLNAILDSNQNDTGGAAADFSGVILSQQDLEEGCKLQMRSSLSVQHQDNKLHPKRGLKGLVMSQSLQDRMTAIMQMEQSRAVVHGSWGGIGGHNSRHSACSDGALTVDALSGEVDHWCDTRKSTICAFAGPAGCGKRTLLRALAFDLDRVVHMVHASDLVSGLGGGRRGGGDIADTVAATESLLHDARIGDAVVAIDSFEHLLDQGDDGGRGWKLNMLLSRLLDTFASFPGLIVLVCHVDNPQSLILQKDFASKIFSFVRFSMPSHEVRAEIWKDLTPPNAPIETSVNYAELGRRFELFPGSISKAVSRACAVAFARMKSKQDNKNSADAAVRSAMMLCQKDFMRAGEEEVAKLKGENMDVMNMVFL